MDPVQKAIEEARETGIAQAEITLSTGVVLRGKTAPPILLIRIMGAHPRPKAPVVYMKAMGREMLNEADPAYQEALRAWQAEMSNDVLNALIILGTEFVSAPDGVPGPQDDAWLEEYSLLGQPMSVENKIWRYVTWVSFKAATSADDIKKIQEVVGKLSGVSETSVEQAQNFPGSDKNGGRPDHGRDPS